MKYGTEEKSELVVKMFDERVERSPVQGRWRWFAYWEIYPILLVSIFLRFYLLRTTQFNVDQATIFQMARDAVLHGRLIATSNASSLGNLNPPATIYLLMPPALLSADPFWGAAWTALLGVGAVLLTYVLTCRYYGRLAATLAALLFGLAAMSVFYSRFMWNQNFLLLFVPLYILMLLRGVIERRKGWLLYALILLGWLIQLHESAVLLIFPLLAALVLAPGTVRWRDVLLGGLALLLIYSPYIIWELSSHLSDLFILLDGHKNRYNFFDLQPFTQYQLYLRPYNALTQNPDSLLTPFMGVLDGVGGLITLLLVISLLVVLYRVLGSALRRGSGMRQVSSESWQARWEWVSGWWRELLAAPERCGLLVLLVWQLAPLLVLMKRSVVMSLHYLIILSPGQFILLGIVLGWGLAWLWRQGGRWRVVRIGYCALLVCILLTQFVGCLGSVLDLSLGHFMDRRLRLHFSYYHDLASMQQVLTEADQFAQQYHYQRIYIDSDSTMFVAFTYLISQVHTPVTLFNDACFVLPASKEGSAIFILPPRGNLGSTLLSRFANTALIARAPLLGSPPFDIYTVSPQPTLPAPQTVLSDQLRWLGSQPAKIDKVPSLLTRWQVVRTLAPKNDTIYAYNLYQNASGVSNDFSTQGGAQCQFTGLNAGDQLFVSLPAPRSGHKAIKVYTQLSIATRLIVNLKLPGVLSLPLETGAWQSDQQTLRTRRRADHILLKLDMVTKHRRRR